MKRYGYASQKMIAEHCHREVSALSMGLGLKKRDLISAGPENGHT